MKVMLVGGTGLIGRALTQSLLEGGHAVWAVARHPVPGIPADGLTNLLWDGRTAAGWGEQVANMDALINLAGEPLARWPWTRAQKQRFWDSRVLAGQALTAVIQRASPRPRVLIQASGINHYGLRGAPADESTPPGDDFLSRLTVAWEAATEPVEGLGVRRCVTRLAVVLARQGGLLPLMALPVKLFLGGPLGKGDQPVPWVHLEDVVGAMRHLLEDENAAGAYNLIAPQAVTNAEFNKTLSSVLGRPYWFPAPAMALKAVLGEMSVLILGGRAALPSRLLASGYQFKVGSLEEALRSCL